MFVKVYTVPHCIACLQAKQYLEERNIVFRERNVRTDPLAAEEMYKQTKQLRVPVIQIDNEFILGFDEIKLDAALKKAQESDEEK